MANLHNTFIKFYQNLQIPPSKVQRMIYSRTRLRRDIKNHFALYHPEYMPEFWIQGSWKMKTAIRTKDDECDLDDGVYFYRTPDISSVTLKKWVQDAVDGITNISPSHKNKCIRVQYASNYHIDLPVYYKSNKFDNRIHPYLATRSEGYIESDPKQLVEWFKSATNNNPQLLRIVSYFKAWADNTPHTMPPGLAWTILATKHLYGSERDDIAFLKTAENILRALNKRFSCVVPAVPYDDLFEEYTVTQEIRLLQELERLIQNGRIGLTKNNEFESRHAWKKELGYFFPA